MTKSFELPRKIVALMYLARKMSSYFASSPNSACSIRTFIELAPRCHQEDSRSHPEISRIARSIDGSDFGHPGQRNEPSSFSGNQQLIHPAAKLMTRQNRQMKTRILEMHRPTKKM